jgi:hypothetical protein
VTSLEPFPAAGPDVPPAPSHSDPRAWAARMLRRQVLGIISEVLGGSVTDPLVRLGLLQRMAENPGCPERALLAHLYDRQAQEEPPPP